MPHVTLVFDARTVMHCQYTNTHCSRERASQVGENYQLSTLTFILCMTLKAYEKKTIQNLKFFTYTVYTVNK